MTRCRQDRRLPSPTRRPATFPSPLSCQSRMSHDPSDEVSYHPPLRDARQRLKARALRENRLDDINEEVIRRRLQIYHEETEQTLSFYDPDVIYDIDATQPPLFVSRDILDRLCELQKFRTSPRPSAMAE